MFSSLSKSAAKILERRFGAEDVEVSWQPPAEASHGDAATSVALKLSRQIGKAPREIADALAEELQKEKDIEKVEVAGAGYVNVWLKPAFLMKQLDMTRKATEPAKARAKEAPVIVEGSDPNVAKPLGIHHILPTMIGQSLTNLYRHAGYNVIHWNYMGDWGTQFGHLSVAVKKWGKKKTVTDYSVDELLTLYVRFHDEAENDKMLLDEGREAFRALEQGDAAALAFWADVVKLTKEELVHIFKRLHVAFDLELSESFYNDKMDPIIEEGIKKGVFKEGERGALIVEFPAETNMPVYMVRRSDGATLYSTRDLAQMRYRMDTYKPLEINIPTDVSQKLHFEQLVATCKLLGWELPPFDHVIFGRMRFVDKKMSTRKGNILKLKEVLDESVKRASAIIEERGDAIQTEDPAGLAEMMGIGAVVYGVLSQNRKMDVVFDWDKMLSFEGNSAPYLQYTHARAKSVLRKAESAKREAGSQKLDENDRALVRVLLKFPGVLEEARAEHLPHKLANYLYDVAQSFNGFYNASPILKAPEPERSTRLFLTDLTATVLRAGAELLTLRVPDRM
jgi:arginyl-tRNA synthetase